MFVNNYFYKYYNLYDCDVSDSIRVDDVIIYEKVIFCGEHFEAVNMIKFVYQILR